MKMAIDRQISWLAFPLVLGLSVALHATMTRFGVSPQFATYVPVLMAAALVTLLEIRLPHRPQWRPDKADVGDDLVFMTIVQLVLPTMIVIMFTFALIPPVHALQLPVGALWPHSLPVAAQVVLMILAVDLLHYVLHRSAHTFGWLWRLHQVHHSPEKLYWLNVGRFHPIEKVLQMFMDTFPFLLLGVGEQVVAAYFVIYAANGFFKHSNIRLAFGPLNYVFSTAELHRWHHSRTPEESNRNYGNVTILWDLVFGTWFLPKGREITDIGIRDRGFPKRFLGQLAAPLAPLSTNATARLRRCVRSIMVRTVMAVYATIYWLPLKHAALHPRRIQERVLRRILDRHRGTAFGTRYGFGRIRSAADYVRDVPVHTYEDLRRFIETQDETGATVLTAEAPVMYAGTSGTTGQPKNIPVLGSTLRDCAKDQRLFSYLQYRNCPEAFTGKVLAIGSPAVEGSLPSGTPCGSLSGRIYESMPSFVKANYVIPAEIFAIDDYDLKYKVILRLALGEPEITLMAAANPSSFLRLQAVLEGSAHEMAESLEHGTLAGIDALPPRIRETILARLRADPARASELRRLASLGKSTFADLWPGIKLLSTWTGGSCGIALDILRQMLPPDTRVLDLGYLSSEFRGTLTSDAALDGGIPTIHRHFFEFVERDAWDRGERDPLLIDQLEAGREYYILVTTDSGLYRYFMNDIVRVTGHYRRTPILRFVQKGKGVTSITGEKLYEGQVMEAVRSAEEALDFNSVFYVMIAEEHAARYALYLEPQRLSKERVAEVAEEVDANLSRLNMEYRAKRTSSRLGAVHLRLLTDGSADEYKRYHVAHGQREGQFKPVTLEYRSKLGFPIDRYVLREHGERAHAH